MKQIKIPMSVISASQQHPDGHIKDLAKLAVDIVYELNNETDTQGNARDNPRESRDSEQASSPFEYGVEPAKRHVVSDDIVPPKDRCREKLEQIRRVIEGWYKTSGTHPAVTLQRHMLAELLKIIDE